MRKTSAILAFGLVILTDWSCVNPYKSAARYRKKYDNRIADLEKRGDIILIKSIWDIKSDTLNVTSDRFTKSEISIVIPGTNTFNFFSIYDISTGQKIGIDSTSCRAGEFLTLKINKGKKGEYLLSNWGCHYGRTVHLRVD